MYNLEYIFSFSNVKFILLESNKNYNVLEKHDVFSQYLEPLELQELSENSIIKIIYNKKAKYEKYYDIKFSVESIDCLIDLSKKYYKKVSSPKNAINLLDYVGSKKYIEIFKNYSKNKINNILEIALNEIKDLKIDSFCKKYENLEETLTDIEIIYEKYIFPILRNPSEDIITFDDSKLSKRGKELFNYLKKYILYSLNIFLNNLKKNKLNDPFIKFILFSYKINKNIFLRIILNKNLNLYRNSLIIFKYWILRKQNIKIKLKLSNILNYFYIVNKINNIHFNDYFCSDIKYKFFITKKYSIDKKENLLNNFLFNIKPLVPYHLLSNCIVEPNIYFNRNIKFKYIYYFLGYASKKKLLKLKLDNVKNYAKISYINEFDISFVLAKKINLPINILNSSDKQRLGNLEQELHKAIIGQDDAISAIGRSIRRALAGLKISEKPIASFLFCGSTGVGKTEIVKTLAKILFGSPKEMFRFDMSEFMEKYTVSRLIGSPPGYVGYEEGGELINKIREKPFCVLLFDEVEKAHKDILTILLQVLDDGRLTDSQKRTGSFSNSLIVLTSNRGAKKIISLHKKGVQLKNKLDKNIKASFSNLKINNVNYNRSVKKYYTSYYSLIKSINKKKNKLKYKNFSYKKDFLDSITNNFSGFVKSKIMKDLLKFFLPEFLNRLDDIIIFKPLLIPELRKICDILIHHLQKHLRKISNIDLIISRDVRNKIAKKGYHPGFGARPLKRIISKLVEDLLADYILANDINTKNKQVLELACDKVGNVFINPVTNLKTF